MNKFGKYAPIVVQILMTILVLNHWYRGLDWLPILYLWVICFGLSISPILDLIYGNTDDDELFDDEYLSDSQYDQTDFLPHKEEMEEKYQPFE